MKSRNVPVAEEETEHEVDVKRKQHEREFQTDDFLRVAGTLLGIVRVPSLSSWRRFLIEKGFEFGWESSGTNSRDRSFKEEGGPFSLGEQKEREERRSLFGKGRGQF